MQKQSKENRVLGQFDVDLSVDFKKANVDSAFNKLKEVFFETLNGKDTLSEKENSGEILIPYKSELL